MKKAILGILLGFIVFLAGCATTQRDIDRATSLCGLNGGVSEVKPQYKDKVKVTCNNGAEFKVNTTF